MSVQAREKPASSVKKIKTVESLTTPKKRKHDTDDRESSKKKKKPRTEDGADTPVTAPEPPTESKDKKKKKKKQIRDDSETTARVEEEVQQAQDIELLDAPALEQEQVEEAGAKSLQDAEFDVQALDFESDDDLKLLDSENPSSFYSTRLSLYVSIPAISLEAGTSSILATHLAPLLLTYFPPAQGIVLAFSDPVLSAKPNSGINLAPLPPQGDTASQTEVFAGTADEFGVCCVWLTVTFLVFRPRKGDALHGWTNVTSEGFVGLVSYNYFQTAVGKTRIPSDWNWSGPSREQTQRHRKRSRKGRLRGEDGADSTQETDTKETDTALVETESPHIPLGDDGGYFADADGVKIESTLSFRVVDTEIVPAHDRHKWSLQIDGTLLDEAAEEIVVEEERTNFERAQNRGLSKSPGVKDAQMSGALSRSMSREGSVASRMSGHTPGRHRRGTE